MYIQMYTYISFVTKNGISQPKIGEIGRGRGHRSPEGTIRDFWYISSISSEGRDSLLLFASAAMAMFNSEARFAQFLVDFLFSIDKFSFKQEFRSTLKLFVCA